MADRFIFDKTDEAMLAGAGLGTVSDVLSQTGIDVAAVSRSSDVLVVVPEPRPDPSYVLFVKRYRYSDRIARFKQIGRGSLAGRSRARREFELLTEMRRRGIEAVRSVAWGERARLGMVDASILITEGTRESETLDVWAFDALEGDGGVTIETRRALCDDLGGLIGRMHRAGVFHDGLFWRNIVLPDGCPSGRFAIIDPGARGRVYQGNMPPHVVVSDLAQFMASALALGVVRGASRFFRAYYGVTSLTASQRQMARSVLVAARKLAPEQRHRHAVAHLLSRLGQRVRAREAGSDERIASIGDYFSMIHGREANVARSNGTRHCIVFSLTDEDGSVHQSRVSVDCNSGQLTVSDMTGEAADLRIKARVRLWLSIVNADPDAFAAIREGELTMRGDTLLLARLAPALGL